jgi:hypothetical protein
MITSFRLEPFLHLARPLTNMGEGLFAFPLKWASTGVYIGLRWEGGLFALTLEVRPARRAQNGPNFHYYYLHEKFYPYSSDKVNSECRLNYRGSSVWIWTQSINYRSNNLDSLDTGERIGVQ